MALQIEDRHHKFSARIGEKTVAVLPYREDGDRVILKATRVAADYWGTDVATELFDAVLTGLRARGKMITILCPLVRAHVDQHPDFASIIHPDAPGLSADGRPSIEEMPMNTTDAAESPIMVRNNEDNHTYEATIDDELLGLVVYEPAGDSRLVLTHAAVEQDHRNHGIATELITSMLDDIRRNRQTITVYCEVVVEFLRKHPEYADLIDPVSPGHAEVPKQQSAD